MAEMMKLERLLDLVALLLETEQPLGRHEIRNQLPPGAYAEDEVAFRRTFERDKDELRDMGLPIGVDTVPGTDPPLDGYSIRRSEFEADLPVLDAEEMASLALASALVRFDAARPDVPIWLLGGSPSADGGDRTTPVAEVADGPLVRELMGAVMERRVVSFDYRGERRTVEPHRLVFTRGHWQLSGLDRGRGAGRQYRCDRFEGPVFVTDEVIAVPGALIEVREDHAWQFGDGDEVAVDLLVDKRHVPWLTSFLRGVEIIEKREDGSVLVREMVRDAAAFRSFVLTFLDGAEVVAPTGFRDEMVSWLEALA